MRQKTVFSKLLPLFNNHIRSVDQQLEVAHLAQIYSTVTNVISIKPKNKHLGSKLTSVDKSSQLKRNLLAYIVVGPDIPKASILMSSHGQMGTTLFETHCVGGRGLINVQNEDPRVLQVNCSI